MFLVLSCFEIEETPFLQCVFRIDNWLHETVMNVFATDLAVDCATFMFHSFHVAFVHMKSPCNAKLWNNKIYYCINKTENKFTFDKGKHWLFVSCRHLVAQFAPVDCDGRSFKSLLHVSQRMTLVLGHGGFRFSLVKQEGHIAGHRQCFPGFVKHLSQSAQ